MKTIRTSRIYYNYNIIMVTDLVLFYFLWLDFNYNVSKEILLDNLHNNIPTNAGKWALIL